jgi:diguanylate cyclase (GGDEF)-like protein
LLARTSFLRQLALTFSVGILCLALLSSLAISTLSSRIVHAKLIEQGLQATETLAGQSALALLYLSADNAEEPLKAGLAFPDVRGAGIYDLSGRVLLDKGENPVPPDARQPWPRILRLELETPEAWYFAAPVYVHRNKESLDSPFLAAPKPAELIGFVRVKMGKDTLKTMAASILRTNLFVSVAFALLLLLLLLAITKRLTNPLKNLATIMGKASSGEKNLRADVRGPKDIIDMERAFNSMMAVLETRELQLENARDAALESARIKGEFAANVSHELRTPLNGVLGMLELLHDMGLTPKQHEYVSVARNAGESLLKLIEDILDFSRTDSGKLKFQPVDFDLQEIMDEVVGLLASQAQRKQLDLAYSIDESVPPRLRGEPARIRQILVNLIGNAVKFTERGSVEVKVRVGPAPAEGKAPLRFEVADTGIGIPAEAQQRIFEAFTQADGSTTRNFGGTGLGLAICRKLVEFMGGAIGVESQPGKGSAFWFTIPLEEPAQAPGRRRAEREGLSGLRVIVVDDSPGVCRALERFLKSWGASSASAATGSQALKAMRAAAGQGRPYHIALVDQAMPGLGGTGLADHIASDPSLSGTLVLLLTGQPEPDWREPRPDNIAGRVSKPVQASALYDCLMTACAALPRPAPARDPVQPFAGKRVLVVEDNRASQQVALGMLERMGCETRIADTGLEALEWIAREAFDLVLMDCQMPQMDGYEAARRIRAAHGEAAAHTPIIAMTANAQSGDSDLCIAAGMDDYLPKPLKLDSLKDKLKRWLAHEKDRLVPPAPASVPAQDPERPAVRLDRAVLRKLRDETGGAFDEIVEAFLEDTPAHLRSLEKAISLGDAELIEELAHCIKGGGRIIGAHRLATLAKQLENQGRAGSCEGAAELFALLEAEFEGARDELEARRRAGPEGEAAGQPDSPRIVVADDDRAMRFALHNVLQQDGYRVEQATNGQQALALCARCKPDLVLMDARMPKMDGFTACSRIRELPEVGNVPVLIITALDDDHSIERAFSAGASDYIPKPVHFAVLRQRVARMLEASRAQQHVTRLAYEDALTGLPNRTLFRERLETLVAERPAGDGPPRVHAILFLDLDRFKLTNDTMGHEVGDMLLKVAAERIRGCLGARDIVSRFGGDEFIAILADIGAPDQAAGVAERIRAAVCQPFSFLGRELYISTSIGIAMYPADGDNGGLLIKHADMAMFRAKERGNGFRFFEVSMASEISRKLRLESDLRRALDRGELLLHYQPQADLATGAIVGVEALVRWQHPYFGQVPPSQFIPLAEETGLIESIGEWVLRAACAQNKAWQEAGLPPMVVAVNLSARQLDLDYEARVIGKALADTGLEPRYLELELTESTVMKDPAKTRDTLRGLKARGISISIDDFGTGYSSLNHLKHFPFDKLKIDQTFISDMTEDSDDQGIVLTILAIARTMKLKVIAEGVETQEQMEYLKRHGCDEIQGYYCSRPLPPDEATALLRRRAKPVRPALPAPADGLSDPPARS